MIYENNDLFVEDNPYYLENRSKHSKKYDSKCEDCSQNSKHTLVDFHSNFTPITTPFTNNYNNYHGHNFTQPQHHGFFNICNSPMPLNLSNLISTPIITKRASELFD